MASAAAPQVGELLRNWRRRRSLSQLDLALDAAVSSRHVSFLETGRSRPSREMVLHLAEHLDVPLRERNTLLLAAGFAPLYPERSLEEPEMEAVRAALDRFLRSHEPYPAVVLDGRYDIVAQNDAVAVLLDGVAPELLEPPVNALRLTLHPDGMAPRILNFAEWSAHLVSRMRRRAQITGDERLADLRDELMGYPGVASSPPHEGLAAAEIVLPLRLRDGDSELAFFSTMSTFGTAADVTLSELSVEAFYPANASTAQRLLADISAA
jgi:transcriptional regulator with XRE-family HTH domain